jgi:hypothetical protein
MLDTMSCTHTHTRVFLIIILPSGHHVVVVNNLNERLDLGTLGGLLLTHGLGNLERRTFDTSNNGITVRSILGTFVMVYY